MNICVLQSVEGYPKYLASFAITGLGCSNNDYMWEAFQSAFFDNPNNGGVFMNLITALLRMH